MIKKSDNSEEAKISELSNKPMPGNPTAPQKKRLDLDMQKLNPHLKISASMVLWILFACVIIAQIFIVYGVVIKNLIFRDPTEDQANTAVVRVNFVNYNRVIQRLDGVYEFLPSQGINFFGVEEGAGRGNPFADPQ